MRAPAAMAILLLTASGASAQTAKSQDRVVAMPPASLAVGADGVLRPVNPPDQPPQVIKPAGGDGYLGELTHMIESIRSGRPPTVVTARDAVGAVEICEAEEESIRTRQIVPLA